MGGVWTLVVTGMDGIVFWGPIWIHTFRDVDAGAGTPPYHRFCRSFLSQQKLPILKGHPACVEVHADLLPMMRCTDSVMRPAMQQLIRPAHIVKARIPAADRSLICHVQVQHLQRIQ